MAGADAPMLALPLLHACVDGLRRDAFAVNGRGSDLETSAPDRVMQRPAICGNQLPLGPGNGATGIGSAAAG